MEIPTNLEEHLERDMQTIKERISKMAALVLRQLENAVTAFTDSDIKLAYAVVLNDNQVDVMEDHIDRLIQEFLIRHMPVSEQLRFIMAVAKVNSELERIGDYAEAIAKKAVTISEAPQVPERKRIQEMARLSFQMLSHAVDAFIQADPDMAVRTLDSDRLVDRMNSEIFESLASTGDREVDLLLLFALLGVINRIERVADRACNIAEETVYVARGEVLRHIPREDMRILFLCDHNACRSQMAEGIARHLAPPNFIFSSAGTNPTQIDPRTIEFMKEKGIDISRQRAKGLTDIGPIEDFNAVVTVSQGAEEACPDVPYDAVHLHWDVKNPSLVQGTNEEIKAIYTETFDLLHTKIKDLIDGLQVVQEREHAK